MENSLLRIIILLVVICYVISPIDGFPGPFDDLLVVFLGQAMRNSLSDNNWEKQKKKSKNDAGLSVNETDGPAAYLRKSYYDFSLNGLINNKTWIMLDAVRDITLNGLYLEEHSVFILCKILAFHCRHSALICIMITHIIAWISLYIEDRIILRIRRINILFEYI